MAQKYRALDGLFFVPVRAALRIFQFVCAIITIGLIGADFSSVAYKSTHIYALFAAVVSILVDIYHSLATVNHGAWHVLDFAVSVLWAALAGAIGTKTLEEAPASGQHRQRLFATMATGIIGMTLWLASCVLGCVWCWNTRKTQKVAMVKLAEAGQNRANFDLE